MSELSTFVRCCIAHVFYSKRLSAYTLIFSEPELPPTEVKYLANGTKIVTEYRFNEDDKKEKVRYRATCVSFY